MLNTSAARFSCYDIKAIAAVVNILTGKNTKILRSDEQKIIDKGQVLKVLDRTAYDDAFCADLINNGTEALKGYNLSSGAKASILSGDINWIEKNIGKVDHQPEGLFA